MSNNLYNGSSEGFHELCDGYIDYAKEVIAKRSVPSVFDGLKPVGRRTVYACSLQKGIFDSFFKCGTLVGKVMEYHPHGDSAIYLALCGMTDSHMGMCAPIFEGQGDLGSEFSTDKPAAMRYTKAKLGEIAKDYLRDMEACVMIPSEEGEGHEPKVLPVRFPAALTNGTSGMAVSVSTSTPSFNFLDVINLTQERIKKGECTTVITPDFPTGGIIVKNDAELVKIMRTGVGKLKIRAKVEIAGKEILVKEVPYGRTVEGIIKAIDRANITGLQSASDDTGQNSDTLIRITCKTMKIVESVLMQLYKHRILQNTFSSNMLFVENEEPLFTGVYGVIDKWLEWRRGIVRTLITKDLDRIRPELERLSYFMRLVNNPEWKAEMLERLAYKSKQKGREYLQEIFEDIPQSVVDWIIGRDVPAYNNGDRYANRYEDLLSLQKENEDYLSDIDSYIYNDLELLKKERSQYFDRRTTETYYDYRFSKISDSEIVDDSFCVYTLYEDGFLTKTREEVGGSGKKALCTIKAQANSTLIGFDCYGQLLRVYGEDIPFTAYGERGEYLPKYFGVEGFDGDYRIMYLGLLDGTKRMLIYSDGFVGFLDTSEFVGKKKIKTVLRGVDDHVYDSLVEVVEESEYTKADSEGSRVLEDYLVVADDSGRKVRFGVTKIDNIREASRKSRAKVFGGKDLDIGYCAFMSYMELIQFMEDPFNFVDRLKPLGNRRVYGDESVIMKEGRYYEQRKNSSTDR